MAGVETTPAKARRSVGLSEVGVELTFLDYDGTAFTGGVVITSAHIAKGLEFDTVIVPDVDDTNYAGRACTTTYTTLTLG